MLALILSHPPRNSAEKFDANWMLRLSDKVPSGSSSAVQAGSITPMRDEDPLSNLPDLKPIYSK